MDIIGLTLSFTGVIIIFFIVSKLADARAIPMDLIIGVKEPGNADSLVRSLFGLYAKTMRKS